jgi:peptidylprolyl isomerase
MAPRPPPLRPLRARRPADVAEFQMRSDGLGILDLVPGEGAEAIPDALAVVETTAWRDDGELWDSTRERREPTRFVVGKGQVAKGWDQGVVGMRAGGVRQVLVPPALGFEDGIPGRLPAGTNHIVQLELVEILTRPGPPAGGRTGSVGGLEVNDLVLGEGAPLVAGATARIDYVGWRPDGTEFDSTWSRPAPIAFRYGSGILRWEAGFEGMRAGGRREVVVPPDQAFGAEGRGEVVPPNATVVFTVDLRSVE